MDNTEADIATITKQLSSTTLKADVPRRSTREKRVRFLPDTIPWASYRELHYSNLITAKCKKTDPCRYRICKQHREQEETRKAAEMVNRKRQNKKKAKKILKRVVRDTRKLKKMRYLRPATTNVVKCLRYLINRSMKRRISTQSGSDWIACNTEFSGTRVQISGLISINFRGKNTAIFTKASCARCIQVSSLQCIKVELLWSDHGFFLMFKITIDEEVEYTQTRTLYKKRRILAKTKL